VTTITPTARSVGLAWRVVMVGAAALAAALLTLQLRHADLRTIGADLHIGWLVPAVLTAAASIVAAVHNLSAFAPVRLRFLDSIRAQLAVCGIRVVTPSALSTPAVCARYLNRNGLAPAESIAAVGTAQVAQLAMTVVVVGAVSMAGSAQLVAPDPRVITVAVAVTAALCALGAVVARRIPRVQRAVGTARGATAQIARHIRRRPLRAVTGLIASAGLTLAHVGTFACCVAAVGGHLTLLSATAIYLGAAGAGSLVPTPGGVGAVEAALIAGLATAGNSVVTATAAALLVRLLMTWALVPPGLWALRSLRRRGLL
jgi:uncharacterized membrane protein YbhN (UPF0104 family)